MRCEEDKGRSGVCSAQEQGQEAGKKLYRLPGQRKTARVYLEELTSLTGPHGDYIESCPRQVRVCEACAGGWKVESGVAS